MTTATRIAALILGGAIALAAGPNLGAAEIHSSRTLKPLDATSLDAGPKHVIGYFLNSDGGCRLTLIVVDSESDANATPETATTRLVVPISQGKAAHIDAAVSKSLRFTCAPDAATMTVTPYERTPFQQPTRN